MIRVGEGRLAIRSATTVADLYAPLPEDLVGRLFDTEAPDRAWTSMSSNLCTGQCPLYLCAVRGWLIAAGNRLDH